MGYDIPDKVKYREKLFLNLDYRQLSYFVLFALLIWFSYTLPLQNEAKLVLPSLFAILGIGFIFFNLEKLAQDWFSFFFHVRTGGALDPRVRRFVGIHRIEDDTIFLENNQMRAILLVKPLNFELMDETRQKSITLNYRDFLNQLSHPVQIVVRTVNVGLSDYFSDHGSKILNTKDEELIALYNDFRIYEEKFLRENRVKERLYYVIIPFSPSDANLPPIHSEKQRELLLRRLDERIQIVQSKLGNCGLTSYRLNTNQLISLIMSYFEGYVEVNEDYLWRVSVCKSFLEKRGKHA